MFSVYVVNTNKYINNFEVIGIWVEFPITEQAFETLLYKNNVISDRDRMFSTFDIDCDIDIKIERYTYTNYSDINKVYKSYESLCEIEMEELQALAEYDEYTQCIGHYLQMVGQKNYYYLHDITNYKDLGMKLLEDGEMLRIDNCITKYFDYEAYGRDAGYSFTSNGAIKVI